jgi:hypothetical protein
MRWSHSYCEKARGAFASGSETCFASFQVIEETTVGVDLDAKSKDEVTNGYRVLSP